MQFFSIQKTYKELFGNKYYRSNHVLKPNLQHKVVNRQASPVQTRKMV